MTLYMGIDPGDSGAVAIIDNLGVPVTTKAFTTWREVGGILDGLKEDLSNLVSLEKVHGFPGMRVQAVSSLMSSYGGWISLLETKEVPYILTPPQTWQRQILGVIPKGESKERALGYAQRRWPSLNLLKKDHGIVDALCIAEFARQVSLGAAPR